MIYRPFQSVSLSRLGMGNMRLPRVDPEDPRSPIDHAEACRVIAEAYRGGINYFDTAYVYDGGDSEVCLGEAMQAYPRSSYYLATKFNIRANPDFRAVFDEQLSRLQTDHIDFYLLHCLLDGNADSYLESGAIPFFQEQKEKGRISYFGFSSHASPEVLERFARVHDWDFAQLQINYYDWEFGSAVRQYRILEELRIPVMVMEPVRGGRLADLTPEADALLKAAHPDWSIPSWAFRFVKQLSGTAVILSGMSDISQVLDNVSTFSSEETLSNGDMDLLSRACRIFREQVQVPCTSCRYCCDACPMQISIPEFLKVYNAYKVDGPFALHRLKEIDSEGKPSDCIGCGTCTKNCPQNINIPAIMCEIAAQRI